jgi:3-hydroxy-3-methylglutaryl CoA synthase
MTEVGIDAVEIWTGKLQLDLPETFAPAKGEDPGKYTKGLGLEASSFPDTYEDIVTMAANAAKQLMDRKNLSPGDIGRIDVATESAFDHSKPVSTYVAGCLDSVYEGDFTHANKGERKFACVAGTQAVDDAYNWIKAGRNRGKAGLVIATDTALYARGDPGEATQGAGAVAMLIDEDPALTALSTNQGFGSKDETDFLKPNQQFPSVDGKRSVQVYLSRMREAWEDLESAAGRILPGDFEFSPFHTPFPGMVRKAAPFAYRRLVRGSSVEDDLAGRIGRQPREADYDDRDNYEEAISAYMDDLTELDEYSQWYSGAIEPTLDIARRVGNWYTGSVHLARASALRHAARTDTDMVGQELLIASYGSGAQAEIHSETVREGWKQEIESLNLDAQLESRYDLSYEEYENVHDVHDYDKDTELDAFTQPDGEFVFTGWGRMSERTYEYAG